MYQLIDFGNGRKLERFGDLSVDRPCPAADEIQPAQPLDSQTWTSADGRFHLHSGHRGQWHFRSTVPDDWALNTTFGRLQLSPTDFGHLGVFPEQNNNWDWLCSRSLDGLRILNLFAYTGAATLAAASSGALVTHVDSAKNIVRRASDNARLSKLGDAPIRWIVEDVRKFVRREGKRGNRYDGVILDPPSYGHGSGPSAVWKIQRDLPDLLDDLSRLMPQCKMMLFTCHSPGYNQRKLRDLIHAFPGRGPTIESGTMDLFTIAGHRKLNCGSYVRWFSGPSVASNQAGQ